MCVLVQQIVEDPLMRHSAILVFANKQDLVGPLIFMSTLSAAAYKARNAALSFSAHALLPRTKCDELTWPGLPDSIIL